jgi:tetratricopeptide (TPR) repeat protein
MVINKADEAEEFHLKSLAARRHMYGDDHSMTEHALFTIGNFYNNAGNVEKAEPYYLERMLRNRRVLGPDAINTHLAGRDLALIYLSLGRAEEAEKLLAQAITCFESHFDKNNPIVLLTREYQADALTILGRLDEALAIYLNGVKQMRTQKNPDPISLASSLATLGASQMLCKKFEDAEASFRESAELFTKYIPEAWPSFVQKANIGAALLGQKKYAEAEPILVEGIEALKARRQSVPTLLYIQLLETIIELYEATDRTDEVRRYRQELEAASGSAN